jgi:hypothetical protein
MSPLGAILADIDFAYEREVEQIKVAGLMTFSKPGL